MLDARGLCAAEVGGGGIRCRGLVAARQRHDGGHSRSNDGHLQVRTPRAPSRDGSSPGQQATASRGLAARPASSSAPPRPRPGDVVVLSRNCHQSALAACVICGTVPVFAEVRKETLQSTISRRAGHV